MSQGGLTSGDPLGDDDERRSPPPPTGYAAGPRPPGAGAREGFGLPSDSAVAPGGHAVPAAGQLELAGWWPRAGAAIIDGFIVSFVALILLIPLGIGVFGADSDGGIIAFAVGFLLAGLVVAAVALAYAPLMMARTNGQTVGRMATGIRVVRTNGRPMDFGTAALREVVFKWLLIGTVANSFTFGLASLLDVLWPLWDEENRALHDFPVGTRTVRAR